MHSTLDSHASPEAADQGWQPLPVRARGLMALTGALQFALPGAGVAFGPYWPRIGL